MTVRQRLLHVWRILQETKPFWLFLMGLVVPLGFSALFFGWRNALGPSSVFWQILGLSTIAIEMSQTRRRFNKPGAIERARAWFSRAYRALFQPQSIAEGVFEAAGRAATRGRISMAELSVPDAPMTSDERIERLEERLEDLRRTVDAVNDRFSQSLQEVQHAISTERRERIDSDRQLHGELENIALGDQDGQLVGLLWMGCGLAGSLLWTGIMTP